MPVMVLRPRQRVQVDHGHQAVPGAGVDHAVQLAEAVVDELERAGVVLEVPVVDRNADAVHAQPGQKLRVVLAEERREQAVEEQLVPVPAENLADGAAHQRLVRRVAGDEVLHVHPAAETDAPQPDRYAVPVDEAITFGAQETVPGSHNPLLSRRTPTTTPPPAAKRPGVPRGDHSKFFETFSPAENFT